ncbi:uncharacterized protein LOC144588170 [Pogona vitticeps]
MGQAYILRPHPRRRDSHSTSEAGYSESALQRRPERVLLPVLHCTQKGRRSSTHTGLEGSQHLSRCSEVQDGHSGRHHSPAKGRRLVCGGGSEGCLLSRDDPRVPQEVPSLDIQGHCLPIRGSPLRPFHSSSDLHQVYGSGGSLSSSARDPDLPLYRRLADCVHVRAAGTSRHSTSSTHTSGFGPIHQSREVTFAPLSGDGLYRRQTGCGTSSHVHTSRTHQENKESSPEVHITKDSFGKTSTTSVGTHGLNNGHSAPCEAQNAFSPVVATSLVQSGNRQSTQAPQGHPRTCGPTPVVVVSSAPVDRQTLSPPATYHTSDNGRQPSGMGGTLFTTPGSCSVATPRSISTYQPSGDARSNKGVQSLSPSLTRQSCAGCDGQYHHDVLPEQARGHKVEVPSVSGSTLLGMVLPEAHIPSSHPCCHIRQSVGRRAQSPSLSISRMAAGPDGLRRPLSAMGSSTGGHVCHTTQQEVSTICFSGRQGKRLPRGCFYDTLGQRPHLPLPSSSTPAEGHSQTVADEGRGHPDCPLVAASTLVFHAVSNVSGQSSTTITSHLTHSERRECPSPGTGDTPLNSVEDFPALTEVIDKARKPATKLLYGYKWRNFLRFAKERGLQSSPVSLSSLLLYLRHLFDLGLSLSTLKVYTAAIVAFQPSGSESSRWFSHPTFKAFFKGLSNMRPPAKKPVPQWSLQTVLHCLTRHPFEPMASCDLKFLSFKTLFLVAITSARRASELAALRADPPYLQFFKDKVVLHPDVTFLPKVVSDFHVNQPLILPTLFPNAVTEVERMLHSLDVRRALAYYVTRSKDFRQTHRLFLCFYGPRKGSPASSSSLSRWLVSTISLAYELLQKPVPDGLKAHSTRAMATSTALLRGIDIQEICRSATWSNASTFVTHYKLDLRAKAETKFGRAVLTSLLQ